MERLSRLKQSGTKPGDDERLYLLGIENYTKGKYEDAVALWNQVLVLNPRHEKARMNIEKARRKILQIKEYRRG
jgi:cytochrome c-type biogenesis protein CcmH/NrfG